MNELIPFEEFAKYCEQGKCLRKTFISKNCLKENKRIDCYNKHVKSLYHQFFGDTNKYDEQKEFREKIHSRDKTCKVWKILTSEEKEYILKNFFDEYMLFSKQLDVCHIVPRSVDPSKLFDEQNVFLASRYFHGLLDKYFHPVTRERITNDERMLWCICALKGER